MLHTVADRLRHIRTISGLKQNELARLAGLKSSRHIGLIEEGERDNITAQTASGLCEVLGMSLDWFLLGKGDAPTAEEIATAVAAAELANPKPAKSADDEEEPAATERAS
ncbi:MAG TPA: helix-turn-helix transcriptional regulator [Polyangiaceae bacterium]|nr:helix-turn-helix transcriptional regulator [Polyangiaceae bacterium]